MRDVFLHGVGRDAHFLGDLAILLAVDVAGGENAAGVVGQSFEYAAHYLLALMEFGQTVGVVVALREAGIEFGMAAVCGIAPQMVYAFVSHVLVEVCPCCFALDGGEVAPHILESRTDHILAVGFACEEASCEVEKFSIVASEQLVEVSAVEHEVWRCVFEILRKSSKKYEKMQGADVTAPLKI